MSPVASIEKTCPLVSERTVRMPRGDSLTLGGAQRALVMGILNVTPDSFSDGGLFLDPAVAVAQGEAMAAEGADLIDIGGESTRPGSDQVSPNEQIARVVPVITELVKRVKTPVSIDTTNAEVARRALAAGAQIINDVTALRGDDEMGTLAAKTGAPVVLMHMLGTPRTMQEAPVYTDVVTEICDFLRERIEAAERDGISASQLIVDPGFGFGKTLEHNLELLRRLGEFTALDTPILVGTSRKRMLGMILDVPPPERVFGTTATVVAAIERGASIVRVHDVRAAVHAARVTAAIQGRAWN